MNQEERVLEQRIQRLEDIEAIKQLKYRYLHACDRRDIAGIRACFAEGKVHIDFGQIGVFDSREGLIEVFTQMACHEHVIDTHHAQNPQVELLGDGCNRQAKATVDLYFYQVNTQTQVLTMLTGYYTDVYAWQGHAANGNGAWVIVETTFHPVTSVVQQLTGEPGAHGMQVLMAGRVPVA